MKTLAFYLDTFEEGSAAQHVLDRLLFGWPEKGAIASTTWDRIRVPQQALNPAMKKRIQASSKLQLSKDAKGATQGIDAWIIADAGFGHCSVACCAIPAVPRLIARRAAQCCNMWRRVC